MFGIIIFGLLFSGFGALFYRFAVLRSVTRLLQSTRAGLEDAARARLLEKRAGLTKLKQRQGFCALVERELDYCGIKRRFPMFTAEWFLVMEMGVIAICFLLLLLTVGLLGAAVGISLLLGLEYLVFGYARMKEMKSVNENLLKLLDFLGNYSVTAGEITGIFLQVGRYLEEPLKSALEGCCYEAQTTGDVGAAMLSMEERIEHPKFKELVRNMEITSRYCADFTMLVNSSRRSMREYLRLRRERKGMLREAAINMLLLLFLSLFSLMTVDKLISTSIWEILYRTWPGRLALGIVLGIFILFGRQVLRLNK
ncbi:MAG: hypothetical protein NC081_04265 [Roseburia sp.]|nr:hypothetical protein [Roseburia sp.]